MPPAQPTICSSGSSDLPPLPHSSPSSPNQSTIDDTEQISNDEFYAQLIPFNNFEAATQRTHYRPLPDDWLVVIADVQGSTKAIQEGHYKDVNALGVAAIVAVLNAVKPLRIPFVFGGDGATFALPSTRKQVVAEALVATRDLARTAFNLSLRVGMVPMQAIREQHHQVLVAQYRPTEHYRQAMFLGNGLGFAERMIKDPNPHNTYILAHDGSIPAHGDFSGFECRWNEISSPHEETISLLVQARSPQFADQETVYAKVLREIRTIYGDDQTCHPLREERMTLASSKRQLATDISINTAHKSSWGNLIYSLMLPIITTVGRIAMHRKMTLGAVAWGSYKESVIANTDHRKFDEVLRMVISGSENQRLQLRAYLDNRRQAGELLYGIHAAETALMTCVISNYNDEHVHFLDASNGGYALAAKEMKSQM
jgi:hypothetical protein